HHAELLEERDHRGWDLLDVDHLLDLDLDDGGVDGLDERGQRLMGIERGRDDGRRERRDGSEQGECRVDHDHSSWGTFSARARPGQGRERQSVSTSVMWPWSQSTR